MDKRSKRRPRTSRNQAGTPIGSEQATSKANRPADAQYDYTIAFTFIPNVKGMNKKEGESLIQRFASRVEQDEWKVTPDSLAKTQDPSEHAEDMTLHDLRGWNTRLELYRPHRSKE